MQNINGNVQVKNVIRSLESRECGVLLQAAEKFQKAVVAKFVCENAVGGYWARTCRCAPYSRVFRHVFLAKHSPRARAHSSEARGPEENAKF